MATSKPSVCSNTFSLNTRSCACSRYFCKTVHNFCRIFWASEVLEIELNMWYSMLYSASTMLLLLAVQNYEDEASILPICENQSTNLKAEMKSHRQHGNFIYLLFSLKNCTCPGSCIVCYWIWGSLYDKKNFQVKLQTVHYTRWESAIFTQYLYISAVIERFCYYWPSMNFGKHPWDLLTQLTQPHSNFT